MFTALRVTGHLGTQVREQVFTGEPVTAAALLQYQTFAPDSTLGDTLRSLLDHPEHPPLFYLLCWGWVKTFGTSLAAFRGVSALASTLTFVALPFLAWELFCLSGGGDHNAPAICRVTSAPAVRSGSPAVRPVDLVNRIGDLGLAASGAVEALASLGSVCRLPGADILYIGVVAVYCGSPWFVWLVGTASTPLAIAHSGDRGGRDLVRAVAMGDGAQPAALAISHLLDNCHYLSQRCADQTLGTALHLGFYGPQSAFRAPLLWVSPPY